MIRRARTGDRSCGLREHCKEAITGGVDLSATETLELATNSPVVSRSERLETAIAQLLGKGRRIHDVGEQDCDQDPT